MISSGNRSWVLDLGLIRRGRTEISSPLTGKPEALSWSICLLSSRFFPISIVECRLRGMRDEAFGYGDSILFRDSLVRAFAEAWERIWMQGWRRLSTLEGVEIKSSNGFACGPSPIEAEENARAEVVERAIFLTAWKLRRGWSRLQATGLLNHILLSFLEFQGWRLSLFKLSEVRLGNVVCGLGTRLQGGILFDCCYQRSETSIANVQTKVLRSLLRSAFIFDQKTPTYAPLPERGSPSSHADFYANPAHYTAFDFLKTQEDGSIELGAYGQVLSKTLVAVNGFPYVALATNPAWPQLSWGRQSIAEGANPWPHPLA